MSKKEAFDASRFNIEGNRLGAPGTAPGRVGERLPVLRGRRGTNGTRAFCTGTDGGGDEILGAVSIESSSSSSMVGDQQELKEEEGGGEYDMKEGLTGEGGDAWNMLLKIRDDADMGRGLLKAAKLVPLVLLVSDSCDPPRLPLPMRRVRLDAKSMTS